MGKQTPEPPAADADQDQDDAPAGVDADTPEPEPAPTVADDHEGQDDADDDAKGPVTREEFNQFREEQGLFYAELRDGLTKLTPVAEPEPEPEPEPAPPSPEPKNKPEPEPPAPVAEPEPPRYGSRRWFGGR